MHRNVDGLTWLMTHMWTTFEKKKNSFFAALQLNAKMFIEKIALDKYANGKHPSRAPLLSRTHSLTPSFDNNKSNELTKCTNEFLRNVFLWYFVVCTTPIRSVYYTACSRFFHSIHFLSLSLSSTLPIVLLLVRRVFFFFICLCFISFVAYILKYE